LPSSRSALARHGSTRRGRAGRAESAGGVSLAVSRRPNQSGTSFNRQRPWNMVAAGMVGAADPPVTGGSCRPSFASCACGPPSSGSRPLSRPEGYHFGFLASLAEAPRMQGGVEPALAQELRMASRLLDPSPLDHPDAVGLLDQVETVRDEQRGPLLHQLVQPLQT